MTPASLSQPRHSFGFRSKRRATASVNRSSRGTRSGNRSSSLPRRLVMGAASVPACPSAHMQVSSTLWGNAVKSGSFVVLIVKGQVPVDLDPSRFVALHPEALLLEHPGHPALLFAVLGFEPGVFPRVAGSEAHGVNRGEGLDLAALVDPDVAFVGHTVGGVV